MSIDANDNLREAIFAAFAAMGDGPTVFAAKADGSRQPLSEHEARTSHLQGIDEILNGSPLSAFSSQHLSLLELMLAYWRELEVEGAIRAPLPDAVN